MEDQQIRGRLEETRFPDLLLKISDRNQTGVLEIFRNREKRSIYFLDGRIVFASSTDPDERLGELFLRRNKVTLRQLLDCFPKVGPGMRLGTVLVLQGFITPTDLYHGVIDQVKEIIYHLFEWDEGEFEFRPGALPTVEVITLNISTPDLVLDGISRIHRWSWIRKAVISLDAVFRKREGWAKATKQMTLTPVLKSLIDMLDVPRTLEEILQQSPLGNFETCKILWALRTAGIAEQILAAPDSDSAPTVEIPEIHEPALSDRGEDTSRIVVEATQKEGISTAKMMLDHLEQMEASETGAPAAVESAAQHPAVELSFSDLADLTESTAELPVPSAAPAADKWESVVPKDVKNFNERHRYLCEMLRLELGEKSMDFLTRTLRISASRYPFVFDGVHVNEYGEFNESALTANILGNFFEGYQNAFDFLVGEERGLMKGLLNEKIVSSIEAGLKRLEQRQFARSRA